MTARKKLEAGNVNSAFSILSKGVKVEDKKCIMALYYAPKPETIKWHDKCNYLDKNFFQFDLDLSFDEFHSKVGLIGKWDIFRQCASELHTTTDDLTTEDYYNWCLEKKFGMPKKHIESFWDKFTKEFLKSSLLSLLTNLEKTIYSSS